MKFDISCERVYSHPPEKVWAAIIDPAALGAWLMKTDFTPQVDREFRMWYDAGTGGTGTILCKVVEYEPPRRMLWS